MTKSDATCQAMIITGPTGTGKTELAVAVAESVAGEIISADSRQLYRHMDVGTAKPSPALRRRVPHHGLDRLDPNESYSAGRFARDARRWIAEIRARGRTPIVVGGTGFFIRALLSPLAPEPAADPGRRVSLRRYLSGLPVERLRRWLARLDPPRMVQLEAEGGPQRLARSLEVVLLSGRAHSSWLARSPKAPPLPALVFCLLLARDELYRRLDRRFDDMLERGLLDEVGELMKRFPAESPGLKSVGYAELIAHLRGELTLERAVDAAKRSTRRFARRQSTWFRHQLPAGTIWLEADRPRRALVEEIVRRWEERERAPLAPGHPQP